MREEEIRHNDKYMNDMTRLELINCVMYSYERIDHLEGVITKMLIGKKNVNKKQKRVKTITKKA